MLRTMVGAATFPYQPGTVSPMPSVRSTEPWAPKSGQGFPVLASTASSRASSVAFEDSLRAQLVGLGIRIFVISDAAARCSVRNGVVGDLGIVAPPLFARGGIERDDDVLGGAKVYAIADLDRRCLGRIFAFGFLVGEIAGSIGPYALESADVGAIDLAQSRIAKCMIAPAVCRPVACIGLRSPHPLFRCWPGYRPVRRRAGLATRHAE